MTAIIIPVKPPLIAKQRLAGVLNAEQRAGLVLAMLQDVLEAVSALQGVTAWVVSNDEAVLKLALEHAAGIIHEPIVIGYNAAVEFGLSYLKNHFQDNSSVAIVPGDVPLASVEDLDRLTAGVSAGIRTVRLAPSQDLQGTNGLFLSATDLLKPEFGIDSFKRYQRTCLVQGLKPEILGQTTLAFDIDRPADLDALIELDTQSAAGEYLRSIAFIAGGSKRSDNTATDSTNTV